MPSPAIPSVLKLARSLAYSDSLAGLPSSDLMADANTLSGTCTTSSRKIASVYTPLNEPSVTVIVNRLRPSASAT